MLLIAVDHQTTLDKHGSMIKIDANGYTREYIEVGTCYSTVWVHIELAHEQKR